MGCVGASVVPTGTCYFSVSVPFFFFCSGGKGGGVWHASRAYCPTGLKLKRKYQLGTVNSLYICPRRKSKIRFFGLPHSTCIKPFQNFWRWLERSQINGFQAISVFVRK